MLEIGDFENAIVAALGPLKTELGVRVIETLGDDLDPEKIAANAARTPAVYVVYGGSRYADRGQRQVETVVLFVFAVDRSLRSGTEARQEGAYALLRGARRALNGATLLTGVSPCLLRRQETLYSQKGAVVCYAAYEIDQYFMLGD